MKLHENQKLFEQAVRAAAEWMGILPIYIEKDYWVCYALKNIFESEAGQYTVFKGGTALSKCFALIDRFSEDIDLVAMKSTDESGNQLKEKLRKISKSIGEELREVEVKGISKKYGMIRKLAYEYPKTFKGDFGQVRNIIILECSWLARAEPYTNNEIRSYIYDMMIEKGQSKLIEDYDLAPFRVQVLDVKRTISEKIMSLIRFSHSENPIEDLKKKVRHIYDLHQLLSKEEFNNFLNSIEFEEILLQVKEDDTKGLKTSKEWINKHPSEALLFHKVEKSWEKLKTTYSNEFTAMVYGNLPKEPDVLKTLIKISNRLKTIHWK